MHYKIRDKIYRRIVASVHPKYRLTPVGSGETLSRLPIIKKYEPHSGYILAHNKVGVFNAMLKALEAQRLKTLKTKMGTLVEGMSFRKTYPTPIKLTGEQVTEVVLANNKKKRKNAGKAIINNKGTKLPNKKL